MGLVERDQKVIWHPYTQDENGIATNTNSRGEGTYLFAEDGTKYIDAISSWWTNIHGHAHRILPKK